MWLAGGGEPLRASPTTLRASDMGSYPFVAWVGLIWVGGGGGLDILDVAVDHVLVAGDVGDEVLVVVLDLEFLLDLGE